VKIGRNDPCPCGSGAKTKRCCGVGGARRAKEALEDSFTVAFQFPRQRPASATFDAWAARAEDRLGRELVEEGLTELGAGERARIPDEFAAAYPRMWETIVGEAGSRDAVLQMILIGAVVAGLEERNRGLDPGALELLQTDQDARNNPVECLALVLTPGDLWNVLEIVDATESLDQGATTTATAERLWTEWHEHRLRELVRRLRDRLPVEGFTTASSAIETACQAFERDSRIQTRLRAELILDALPTVHEALRLVA
jgi:hypothetical protein